MLPDDASDVAPLLDSVFRPSITRKRNAVALEAEIRNELTLALTNRRKCKDVTRGNRVAKLAFCVLMGAITCSLEAWGLLGASIRFFHFPFFLKRLACADGARSKQDAMGGGTCRS